MALSNKPFGAAKMYQHKHTHAHSKGYQRLILHTHKSGKYGADFDQTYFKCVQLLQEIAASSTKEMNEKPS
jgi:hypothetical protein